MYYGDYGLAEKTQASLS